MGETTLWSACGRNGETFGLQCFAGVADAGCAHQVVKTGSGPKAARSPAFKWVNTALGNIKAAITGTYRAITRKHAPRYLAEFEYRFTHTSVIKTTFLLYFATPAGMMALCDATGAVSIIGRWKPFV